MATSCTTYTLEEFQVAIQKEGTSGTAELTDGGSETGLLVDISGPPTLTKGVYRDEGFHAGDGRTAKNSDYKASEKGQINTITFSTYADQSNTTYLYENLIGTTVGTSPASWDIASGFTSRVCHGDTDTDWTGTITVALVSPESSATRIMYGAKVENMVYNVGNSQSDGGRSMVDWTISSQYPIVELADSSGWTLTAYATDEERYIYDLFGESSVSQIHSTDVILDSFSITVNGNVQRNGYQSSGGNQVTATGMPEIEVLGDFTVKYDGNSKAFFDEIQKENDIEAQFTNNAWASTTYGFKGDYGHIRDSFNPEAVNESGFITIPLKFFDNGSGDLLQIVF